jgi:mannosyltransferase
VTDKTALTFGVSDQAGSSLAQPLIAKGYRVVGASRDAPHVSSFASNFMSSQLPVVLDSIIFGLQRYGGISNYWARLLNHGAASSAISVCQVLPRHICFREFDTALTKGVPALQERLPARVSRYMRARIPDSEAVFHTSYYRLPRTRVSKYVVSAYDFSYERYRKGIARYVHTAQKRESLRRADAVLCISHSTKQDVLEFCEDIDASKLYVTHLGVDADMFFPDSAKVAGHETTVLFVGQRDGYKRFDLAAQAVQRCPRLKLGIVGPPLSAAERDVLQAKLGRRWQEIGPISTEELRRLYSSVFAFIYPSDYEGFGLPVLEAMACGCPVVAANRSSLPEVGADAASYAPEQRSDAYADAIDRLSNDATRAAQVHAGIVRAAEFSWARTFERTLSIYLGLPMDPRQGGGQA